MNNEREKITLSVKQVSEVLGIGINQAYDLVHRADFPALKIGNRYLISKAGLEAWIESQIQNRS